MISIAYSADDLVGLRFAYSPLIELSTSYMLVTKTHALNHGSVQFQYSKFLTDALENLRDVEMCYLKRMVSLPGEKPTENDPYGCNTYIADFLTPTPTSTRQSIEDELDRLRETPHENVRKMVQYLRSRDGDDDGILQHFLDDTGAALDMLIDDLREYWKRVLAPHWPQMRSILENDVLFRARQMALEGTDTLFANLSQFINLQQGKIIYDHPPKPHQRDEAFTLSGKGLQLVPTIFSGKGGISWQVVPEYRPMIIYGARGTGLWNQGEAQQECSESLEITIGAGKARILQALIDPVNTGELARKLNVTAGAISQHLGKLSEAGLVESYRSGNRVFYRLSPRGEQLLEVFAS